MTRADIWSWLQLVPMGMLAAVVIWALVAVLVLLALARSRRDQQAMRTADADTIDAQCSTLRRGAEHDHARRRRVRAGRPPATLEPTP